MLGVRRAIPPILAALGLVCIAGTPALADGTIVVGTDNNGGTVNTTVTSPGSGGGTTQRISAKRGSRVHCTYTFPGDGGQSFAEDQNGVPGRYYYVDCSRGAQPVSSQLIWFADTAPPPGVAPTVTPGKLAQRAVDELPLPTPQPRHSPDRMDGRPQTVVGVPTWWWLDSASFQPTTHTVRAGAVWATVTARPTSTFWQSGSADGNDVRCDGPGTAYDTSRPAEAQQLACATVYRRSSANQPQTGPSLSDRYFIASVTVTWQVTWVGAGGASGALPPLTRTARFPIAVAEVQTVNQ